MPTDPLPFDPIAEARRNWEAHGLPAAPAMVAVTSITRAHQLLLGRINAALRPHGLTFARFEVLALLRFSRRGSLPLAMVGERLQVSPASVTNAVDRLEADGLVARAPHPTDGRATLAVLTEAGRDRLRGATSALGSIRFGAEGLDDAAAVQVADLLTGLRVAAGDFRPGDEPPSRAGDDRSG